MGQYFFTISLVFSIVFLTMAMNKKDAKEALESFGSNCNPPPSDDDYEAVIMNTEDASQSAKCLRSCLMKQGSMFDSDGKLDVEQMKAYMGMMFEGKEQIGEKMAVKCNAEIKEAEPCQLAHLYSMCLLKELKENGLQMEPME